MVFGMGIYSKFMTLEPMFLILIQGENLEI